ncbi:MAG: MoaD/ThiS family protein [Deltaproteobacteria bacterium]|nr:MoaD/ThiS family protein [Deltaproteobacteria bacterium]
MRVKVQLFAFLREALGDAVELEVPEPVTAGKLKQAFLVRYPQYQPAAASLRVAVDHEFAGEDTPLGPNSETALLPPVTGG